jgi:hypothetical protein
MIHRIHLAAPITQQDIAKLEAFGQFLGIDASLSADRIERHEPPLPIMPTIGRRIADKVIRSRGAR